MRNGNRSEGKKQMVVEALTNGEISHTGGPAHVRIEPWLAGTTSCNTGGPAHVRIESWLASTTSCNTGSPAHVRMSHGLQVLPPDSEIQAFKDQKLSLTQRIPCLRLHHLVSHRCRIGEL